MDTKKIFLLSYDIYLFSAIKAWLPDLLLADMQTVISESQQFLPQCPSCLLIIDNRLPIFVVKKWLQQHSSQFMNMNSIVIRMSATPCINRGYETLSYVDARMRVGCFIRRLQNLIVTSPEDKSALNSACVSTFRLTIFEKEMLQASFTKEALNKFCRANAVTLKMLYRYRNKINTRLGFHSYIESIIFLSRNGLLLDTTAQHKRDDAADNAQLNASRLSMAILCEEIIPYYQPILSARGEVCGVEILTRWPQGRHYAISQKEILPLAIRSGLIFELFSYLMTRVARDFSSTKIAVKNPLFVSFNIGPAALSNPVFYWECLNFIELTQRAPIKLMIEITENQALNFTPAIKELIRSLRNRGVMFALDDFGTGYSNLHYLNELELDVIKIDKSFIKKIKDDEQSVPMLESIIHLADILDLRTVAEGVEYAYQQQWLVKNRIDFLQGYYFLPPAPFAEFIRYQQEEAGALREMVSSEGCWSATE